MKKFGPTLFSILTSILLFGQSTPKDTMKYACIIGPNIPLFHIDGRLESDGIYRDHIFWEGAKYIYDRRKNLVKIKYYKNGVFYRDSAVAVKREPGVVYYEDYGAKDTSTVFPHDFYYELDSNNTFVKAKWTDGYHIFYNSDKKKIKSGVFKDGVFYSGDRYIYTDEGTLDRIMVYKKGAYVGEKQTKEKTLRKN